MNHAVRDPDEDIAPIAPDEAERLWDAFEAVESAAMKMVSKAVGGYVPNAMRQRVTDAVMVYRRLRDAVTEARRDRHRPADVRDYKLDVTTTIEVTGVGLSTPELSCRLETGEHVLLLVPPESVDRVRAAIKAGSANRDARAAAWATLPK